MAGSVKRSEAEVRFRNAQKRLEDGRKAVTEHQAAEEAVRERTARLRALRLAKEAADKEEAATHPKSGIKKRIQRARGKLEKAAPKGLPTKQGGSQERE